MLKTKTIAAIARFVHDPHDPLLRNHPLKGALLGKRAFSVTASFRVVFEEYDHYAVVLMLSVGTHNQVYR
ncbi:MAG: type II toxin-antitoxin system mRNA interferase toxin, RelE/StbE family [Patescibacteria group bacterium]